MNSIRQFLYQHKHFYTLIFLLPLLIWFKYIEATVVPKYVMYSAIDDKIPFVKEFVVPYIIWFAYVVYGIVYTGVYSKQDYYKLYTFLAAGMSICYILYMIFPNVQYLRPVIQENDLFSRMVKFIYLTDTPTDVCPSVHVFNAIAVDSALRNSKTFSSKRYGRIISAALVVSICLSTMFIKQHSIIDVISAVILSLVFYIVIYAVPNVKRLMVCRENYSFKDVLKAAVNNYI